MLIPVLGASGLGLVWGWLAATFTFQVRRPMRQTLWLLAATVVASAEVAALGGSMSVAPFLGAAALALWLHLGWKAELRNRR